MKKNKQQQSGPLNYKQAKTLATSGPMQQRSPANFNSAGQHTGHYGPQAEAQRAQAKQMSKMQVGLKKTVNNLDITGAEKAKIFDQINPKDNSPQRSKKLGY